MKLFVGFCAALCVFAVDMLMGLPTYGLVRTIHGGTFDYRTDSDPAVILWVLLWGLPGLALISLFCWRLFR